MKKFLINLFILSVLMIIPAKADTLPYYTNSIPKRAIGLYQTDDELRIMSHPEGNSDVIRTFKFSYQPETMPDNMFAVLINEKRLGFLYVTDIADDGWVEVIYDKKTGAKGWAYTKDVMQFQPWISFYSLYGKKYGLRLLKDAPEECRVLHSQSEDLSQTISKLNYVNKINLTMLRGNWLLVTVFDLDKTPKTGYLKWRGSDGQIFVFPNVK